MPEEAVRNCVRFGRSNVRLVRTLDDPALEQSRFTFINAYIVLQHINARRGLGIIAALLARLVKGGCAALHVTYARSKYAHNIGAQPLTRRYIKRIRRPLSRLSRYPRGGEPQMQMNAYDMNRLLFLAQRCGRNERDARSQASSSAFLSKSAWPVEMDTGTFTGRHKAAVAIKNV